MHRNFDPLKERLLRAGIAPRRVQRYVTELSEHLVDLTEHERASGLDAAQACDRAKARLGVDAELAQAMLHSAPRLSLAARAPWVVFVMWPVLLLIAVVFFNALMLIHLLSPVRGLMPAEMPEGYRILIQTADIVVNYLTAALLSAGCITLALRQRLASGWMWVGLGLISVFSGFFGFHTHAAGERGGLVYSVGNYVYLYGRPSLGATLAVAAGRAALLFAVAATAYRVFRARLIPALK